MNLTSYPYMDTREVSNRDVDPGDEKNDLQQISEKLIGKHDLDLITKTVRKTERIMKFSYKKKLTLLERVEHMEKMAQKQDRSGNALDKKTENVHENVNLKRPSLVQIKGWVCPKLKGFERRKCDATTCTTSYNKLPEIHERISRKDFNDMNNVNSEKTFFVLYCLHKFCFALNVICYTFLLLIFIFYVFQNLYLFVFHTSYFVLFLLFDTFLKLR